MARRRKRNPFVSQAQEEALVRFGPEISGLQELQRQAQINLAQGVAAARAGSRGIINAITDVRPQVQQDYGQTKQDAQAAASIANNDLAHLGPVASSIRAAIGLERSGFDRRLAASRAADLTDLGAREVQARQGAQFQGNLARSQFVNAMESILNRKVALANEQGAFTARTVDQLRQDAADRRLRVQLQKMSTDASLRNAQLSAGQSERNSLRSAGIDPNTGQAIKGGPLDPNAARYRGRGGGGKSKWLSNTQHAAAADQVGTALDWARRFRASGVSRAGVQALLESGRPAQTVYRTVPGATPGTTRQVPVLDRGGTPRTRPAVPRIKSAILAQAAIEQAYFGHITRGTERALHAHGLLVHKLPGLVSYTAYQRSARVPTGHGVSGGGRSNPGDAAFVRGH